MWTCARLDLERDVVEVDVRRVRMIKLWFVPLDFVFPGRTLIYPTFWGVLVVLDYLVVIQELI